MKRTNHYIKIVAATGLAASSVATFTPVTTHAATFPDVPSSSPYFDAVQSLTSRGIVSGYEDNTFRPGDFATRGQFAKILAQILQLNTRDVPDPGFKDLDSSHPYYGAIAALVHAGIIHGYEDATFRMNERVQRNHLAKMLTRAFQLQADEGAGMPFTDVRSDYVPSILALYTSGITTGKTATQFDGTSFVTRGQLAVFLYRTEAVVQARALEEVDVPREDGVVEPTPVPEQPPEPESITFSLALDGLTDVLKEGQIYEIALEGSTATVYLEGDEVKISFASDAVIPKQPFQAKLNGIDYTFKLDVEKGVWQLERIYTGGSSGKKRPVKPAPVPEPAPTPLPKPTPNPVPTPVPEIIAVTGVSLNEAALSMHPGQLKQLLATVSPINATNKGVSWLSSDETVATVDANGEVTAVGAGVANITVTTRDGSHSATAQVEVSIPLNGISLDYQEKTINQWDSFTLTPLFSPANSSNQAVTWSSSNGTVATVDAAGVVTALQPGTATITVTTADGQKTATADITVVIPVTGIKLNKSAATLAVGATEQLVETIEPATATNQQKIWNSSDPTIATVDAAGIVTALQPGTATITVTTADGQKTATADITVVIPVTGITLNKSAAILAVGATEPLVGTIEPTNATNQKVNWRSSHPNIATVDAAGIVTAVAPGTATITATTDDGTYEATYTVTSKEN